MSSKKILTTKIHVAKAQLHLDETTYRQLLNRVTGKTSCVHMNVSELAAVMEEMKAKGFKPRTKSSRRLSPKSKGGTVDKIRAIWITMAKQNFVRDGSEAALDAYIKRMQGVDHVGWLKGVAVDKALESLKNWHRREMAKVLISEGLTVLHGHRKYWSTHAAPYDYVASAFGELARE